MGFPPPSYSKRYKSITSDIPFAPCFEGLDMSVHLVKAFCRLRLGNNLFPHHSFCPSLNSSPLCPLHTDEAFCDFIHIIIFHCPPFFLTDSFFSPTYFPQVTPIQTRIFSLILATLLLFCSLSNPF